MKKLLFTLMVLGCTMLLSAQTNEHFWYNGRMMFGTTIAQTDSLTFGDDVLVDTLHLLLPRAGAITVHDTVRLYVHDTIYVNICAENGADTASTAHSDTATAILPPTGAIAGLFSVSAEKKVLFSSGNLQFWPAADQWRFASKQYDMIGSTNSKINVNYNGWIDLFGFGTSGFNNVAPTTTSSSNGSYPSGGANGLAGTNYDWGVYHSADLGDGQTAWRTLTNDEWKYLINTRKNHGLLMGCATVVTSAANVKGFVILPDDDIWVLPQGLTFTAMSEDWTTNTYTAEQWAMMEKNGAVFLPADGYREEKTTRYVGSEGWYWSTTVYSGTYSYSVNFGTMINAGHQSDCTLGHCVRLVTDAK